jgi:hypothetical protein
MAHEGVPLVGIQRQHANLGTTLIYLQGIDSSEACPVHRAEAAGFSARKVVAGKPAATLLTFGGEGVLSTAAAPQGLPRLQPSS